MPTLATLGAASARAFGFAGNSFSKTVHLYTAAGSGADAIPIGASTATIEIWGGGGGGRNLPGCTPGAGGGSGAYSRHVVSVGGFGGARIAFTVGGGGAVPVGVGGTSSIASCTFSIANVTDGGGNSFGASTGGVSNGAGNASNVNGNAGGGVGCGHAGAAIVGLCGSSYGGGGQGGCEGARCAAPGATGAVKFVYV